MQVKDVMTHEVVSCREYSTLAVAGQRMLEGRFGVLPVTNDDGKALGMITDRDIAKAAVTRQRNASHILVSETMSTKLCSCHPAEEVGEALKNMVDRCVRRLPVVDSDGRLVGLVSIEDLALRAVGQEGGIDQTEFFEAFKSLCQRPSPEPEIDPSDVHTPG